MKLSVLDQSPKSDGMSDEEALRATIELAEATEQYGYERFWVTEHHDLFGLASPNPAILISSIAARTKTMKIGAGAVLLSYYKPYFVAETYHMLASLYPSRIDLGIGRAPGGPAEASLALVDNYLQEVRHYPHKIDELLAYMNPKKTDKLLARPIPKMSPNVFLLGTSEKSAILAAEKELKYAFGHFMTDGEGEEIVETYRQACPNPYVIIAVDLICAETTEAAEKLAESVLIWRIRHDDILAKQTVPSVEEAGQAQLSHEEKEKMAAMKRQMIIGSPSEVKQQLDDLQKRYGADEMMLVTIVHDPASKRRSYELVANECGLLNQ